MSTNIELEAKATQVRLSILEAVHRAKKGHIGGAFSIVEILVSLYYEKNEAIRQILGADPSIILSKGHAAVAQYAILTDLGYIPREEFLNLNQGGLLGEHPSPLTPGIEFITGSLGHGLSVGCGKALADRFDSRNRRVFVVMGDGECYEGSVWEAAMFASHHQLGGLCAIIDRNGLITHGRTESFIQLEPLAEKWEAFGWNAVTISAHNFEDLQRAWGSLNKSLTGRPTVIIANSIKGRGVSFMESNFKWHHGAVDDTTYALARAELTGDRHVS